VILDHVQLAMPEKRESDARAFFCGILGMLEEAKPSELKGRLESAGYPITWDRAALAASITASHSEDGNP